ncbi:MAG: phosphonate ABC transporter, permease protein PhnE [bacterium]|nr:phosphonate ABC transporter, permease protein PhnE [bacterium]
MAAQTHEQRRKTARARIGAFVFDTLLIGYVFWCVDFLIERATGTWGPLGRYPALLGIAPLVALLWAALIPSLGSRAYRTRLLRGADQPAQLDPRALVALLSALQLVFVAAPIVLLEASPAGWWISAGLGTLFFALSLRDPQARSLPERIAGVRTTTRPGGAALIPPAWHRRPNVWIVLFTLAVTFTVGGFLTDFSIERLTRNTDNAQRLWGQLLRPDWSVAAPVASKLIETIFMALLASTLALPFAFVLSFAGARNVMAGTALGRTVYAIIRFLLNVMRSIEPILWAIILSMWVGVSAFAGMLALFVHSTAALGKLYSEAIESVDPGPVEALRATGAHPLGVLRFGVVPQVLTPFLSFTVYRWDINVRMATILGFVGGGGIGELIVNYTQLNAWSKVGTIVFCVTLVVWVMDVVSSRARERLL